MINLFIIVVATLLVSCSGPTEPKGLQSKPLIWQSGNLRVYQIDRYIPSDTTFSESDSVTEISLVDGQIAVHWSTNVQERVRDGHFEFRYDYDDAQSGWICMAKFPASQGEVLFSDENTRRNPDGTVLGKVLDECTTTSTDTTITVPAGTYRCVVSTTRQYLMPGRLDVDGYEGRGWYAPGVGLIRSEIYIVTTEGGRRVTLRERFQLKEIRQ